MVKLGNYLPGRVTLPDMLLRQPAAQALGKNGQSHVGGWSRPYRALILP